VNRNPGARGILATKRLVTRGDKIAVEYLPQDLRPFFTAEKRQGSYKSVKPIKLAAAEFLSRTIPLYSWVFCFRYIFYPLI
jgi:hypothetical protein